MGKKAKDKRDIYYRKAKEEGYRARSAYKLLQIDEEFNIFEGVDRVVDLCAAPGSWSQVISKRLKEKGLDITNTKRLIIQINAYIYKNNCISVDLFEMAAIEGCTIIKGDITREKTVQEIQEVFEGEPSQLVVSDGAPDILGDHDFDQFVQHQLVLAALNIAIRLLSPGGTFVAKVFRGKDINLLHRQIKMVFSDVYCSKPKCSRNSSIEGFVVAKNFLGKQAIGLTSDRLNLWDALTTINHLKNFQDIYYCDEEEDIDDIIPFVACGKNEEFDADMNYSLNTIVTDKKLDKDEESKDNQVEGAYKYIEPRQKPIDPPYKVFLAKRNELNNNQ